MVEEPWDGKRNHGYEIRDWTYMRVSELFHTAKERKISGHQLPIRESITRRCIYKLFFNSVDQDNENVLLLTLL